MTDDAPRPSFYRSLMTGLFVGILATLACLLFNLIFRRSTGFQPTDLINVATLIFAVNLLFPLLGLVYNGFLRWRRRGVQGFTVLFALLFALLLWQSVTVHRFSDPHLNGEFRFLLTGIVLILGICADLLLPYLYQNRSFEEHVV